MRPRGSRALAAAAAALLAGLGAAAPARGADFRVDSRLEPEVVALGGAAYFTLEVEGPGFQQPRLRPRFELENLEVVSGPDVSHGIRFGTGAAGWRYAWTWRLRPLSAGRAAVVGIHLLVGEREVALAPERLEVVERLPSGAPGAGAARRSRLEELLARGLGRGRSAWPGAGRPGAEAGPLEPPVFFRAEADPASPYVGQRVVYTIYLYTQVRLGAMEPERLPTFRGLWARDVDVGGAPVERVEWEGEAYLRKAILRKELFALASDTHVVEPARIRFLTERIERDGLFLAPVRVPVQAVRETNAVTLEVRPLPAPEPGRSGPPAGPGCAVGRLSLAAALEPRELGVGEGAVLIVSAAGEAHLEALEAPPFRPPEGLELIGPEPATPPGAEEDDARHWRYLLVPRRPGSWRLPAVEMAYFDPAAGRYRTARASVPDLVARPAAGALATAAAVGPAGSAPGGGGGEDGAGPGRRWHGWPGVLAAALALPALAVLVLVLGRRRRGVGGVMAAAGADLRDFRRRLEAAAHEERPRRAAAAVERAWRRFLADARGVAEAVPPSAWPDELLARGARREACRELRRVLADLHYLRFAPELSATGPLAADLVRRSEAVARELVR
ncbi:MAG TPA: hypothetical protein VF150_05000 [Thermoanaerobaculia bacterium]